MFVHDVLCSNVNDFPPSDSVVLTPDNLKVISSIFSPLCCVISNLIEEVSILLDILGNVLTFRISLYLLLDTVCS